MLNRTQILTELYDTGFIQNYTKTFVRANDIDSVDDEIQEIWLIACEIPEEKLQEMYAKGGINAVRRFLSGIIHRQMCSTTSLIYRRYRRPLTNTYSTNDVPENDMENGYKIIENEYKNK